MVKKARFAPSNDTTTIKNMKFMKQIILSLIVLLGASLNACMAKDNQTSETRDISGYTSIRIDGVATVRFAQSDTWSCRIEGKAEELDRLTTTVKNGTLIIDQRKEGKREQNIQGTTLYLSAPTLDEVVQIDIDGVGKGNVNVYCDKLKARADGVSSLKLSGKAHSADIKDGFLSKINDRRLKVEE